MPAWHLSYGSADMLGLGLFELVPGIVQCAALTQIFVAVAMDSHLPNYFATIMFGTFLQLIDTIPRAEF